MGSMLVGTAAQSLSNIVTWNTCVIVLSHLYTDDRFEAAHVGNAAVPSGGYEEKGRKIMLPPPKKTNLFIPETTFIHKAETSLFTKFYYLCGQYLCKRRYRANRDMNY